jgi:cysteine desulfurase
MRPLWEAQFAKPASAEHAMGRTVAEAVEAARHHVAELIGANPSEIILTCRRK